jgi:hypothetical protein
MHWYKKDMSHHVTESAGTLKKTSAMSSVHRHQLDVFQESSAPRAKGKSFVSDTYRNYGFKQTVRQVQPLVFDSMMQHEF